MCDHEQSPNCTGATTHLVQNGPVKEYICDECNMLWDELLEQELDDQERLEEEQAAREELENYIESMAQAIAEKFGGVVKHSGLSLSAYVNIGDFKVRISDHDERPSYAAQNGYADFDISVDTPRDSHTGIICGADFASILSEIEAVLAA